MSRPSVAIVGRPNVGKSTLLNRIIGRRDAIVEEKAGVTRDRKVVEADWIGRTFDLIDTGGWLSGGSSLERKVSAQADAAISEADVVLFVVDASVGVTEEDGQMARRLRAVDVPVLLVANKIDDDSHLGTIWDLTSLGFANPYPVSALHGRGVGDLLDEVVRIFEDPDLSATETDDEGDSSDDSEDQRVFSVALVGRPNVGKSTLFNRLIGEDRSITHDMPGTTRDTIDTVVDTDGGPIRFLDTAGMRRRSRIDEDTEFYSVLRALKSVDRADVALLVIDSTEGITAQDQRLAERVDAAGCPIVLILNKWELLNTEQREAFPAQVERKLGFLPNISVHRISALSGKGVQKLLPSLGLSLAAYQKRVPTRKVNELIRRAQASTPAPDGARVLYATQGATDPPTFTLFTNRAIPDHYLRYLERRLRDEFELGNAPVKLRTRLRSD